MPDAEKWNERYSGDRRRELSGPDDLLVEAIRGRSPGKALDVASGTGRNSLYLAREGWSVSAIDISDVALDVLHRHAAAEGFHIDTVVADLKDENTAIPAGAFDLICNCRYLQRDLFPRLIRALRPGGLLVALIAMADDDPAVPGMNPAYLLRPGELRLLLPGLRLLKYEEVKPAAGKRRAARCIAMNGPVLPK